MEMNTSGTVMFRVQPPVIYDFLYPIWDYIRGGYYETFSVGGLYRKRRGTCTIFSDVQKRLFYSQMLI